VDPLHKVNDWLWELPSSYKPGMRVPGRIYATEKMLEHIAGDNCLEQVANVAFLPGIRRLRPIGAVKASRGRMS
jgi:tRNA-splicing ligase RtcB